MQLSYKLPLIRTCLTVALCALLCKVYILLHWCHRWPGQMNACTNREASQLSCCPCIPYKRKHSMSCISLWQESFWLCLWIIAWYALPQLNSVFWSPWESFAVTQIRPQRRGHLRTWGCHSWRSSEPCWLTQLGGLTYSGLSDINITCKVPRLPSATRPWMTTAFHVRLNEGITSHWQEFMASLCLLLCITKNAREFVDLPCIKVKKKRMLCSLIFFQ